MAHFIFSRLYAIMCKVVYQLIKAVLRGGFFVAPKGSHDNPRGIGANRSKARNDDE